MGWSVLAGLLVCLFAGWLVVVVVLLLLLLLLLLPARKRHIR